MRHKSSGPKYDRISSSISSGKSFSVLCSLAITDGSENTPFLLQYDSYLHLIIYRFKNLEAEVDTSCINS